MTDIVKRLREVRGLPFREKHRFLFTQAANEIERLRAALREIAEDYVDPREVAIRALGQS